jgi:hypothetical protein
MNLSPRQRLLLCFGILTISLVAIAPRPAHASPGIWDWIQWLMKAPAVDDEIKFDVASWITSATTALASHTASVLLVGCSYDDLMYCATVSPSFPNEHPDEEGQPVDRCDPCRPTEPGSATAFMGGGAFGYASAAIQGMSEITPPFSLSLYAQDLTQHTLLGGKVQADVSDIPKTVESWAAGWVGKYYQDIFKEATFAFWKQTRNLAYLLFVIVLIAMGFMVMLRYEVSPRTTITVTSALPKIAIGLVLITFSYPIVSLAVDLIIPLTIVAKNVVVNAWYGIAVESTIFETFQPWASSSSITKALLGTIAAFFGGRVNLFSVVLYLVILGALLITVLLAFWAFLKRFITLVYMGILGPLIIAWGTLPGNEEAISGWFKKIIACVLALPSVVLVMHAGFVILMLNPSSSDAFPLPLAMLSDLTAQMITFWIGLSILWQAHKIPETLEAALTGGGNRR